jgi:hypothetical protein
LNSLILALLNQSLLTIQNSAGKLPPLGFTFPPIPTGRSNDLPSFVEMGCGRHCANSYTYFTDAVTKTWRLNTLPKVIQLVKILTRWSDLTAFPTPILPSPMKHFMNSQGILDYSLPNYKLF